MLAKINSSAVIGLDAIPIEVEVDIASQGLPSFTIVGLPDKAVEEAKERVRSALRNSGADFPARRITVNLAPADIPKEGPSYDLPIAVGVLIASGQLTADTKQSLFFGELALDGNLRKINGVLPQVIMAKKNKFSEIYLPKDNINEATIIDSLTIYPLTSLTQLFHHLNKTALIQPAPFQSFTQTDETLNYEFDMQDIKGQELAKRAMEIAAAGGHNIILKGPPGAGKTLLARTFPSILPPLSFDESLEVTKLYSIAGLTSDGMVRKRPFRAPHHTASYIGLTGGGALPRPGEISLSHRGVLFLDELPEFPRQAIEALRQPLEDGFITVSRAQGRVTFPAKCMLVAAQNPCPCGFFGDPKHSCSCAPGQISRYQKKISGPMLYRIDINLTVPAVETKKLTTLPIPSENSKTIRARVINARKIQNERFKKIPISTNSEMGSKELKAFCQLSKECDQLLQNAVERMQLSARAFHRTIKLARTIADLAQSKDIKTSHLAEALQYRQRQ